MPKIHQRDLRFHVSPIPLVHIEHGQAEPSAASSNAHPFANNDIGKNEPELQSFFHHVGHSLRIFLEKRLFVQRVTIFFLTSLALSLFPVLEGHAQQDAKRELVNVRGDLYRFINNQHASVVYVTNDGIIVGDPINSEAAEWLKARLDEQFSLPVKYLFYSHHHSDRASGGEVFEAAGATVIAHENAAINIAEKGIQTAAPTVVFNDQLTLRLGGKQVELHYLGENHTNDMVVALFPAEEAVFAVDFVSVEQLPHEDLQGAAFPQWYTSIDRLNQLPYTYLVPGHGKVGIRFDAVEHGYYLRELENRIRRADKAGLTLEEMKLSIRLPRYSKWQNYNSWLPMNIQGMARALRLGGS